MPIVKKMKMGTQPKSSASSQPAKPYRPRKEDTKTKLVSFDVDLADLPPLTDAQKAELAALEALPDEDIDTSDIPVLPDIATREAVRGKYYRPTKTSTTVRIDSDVLAWLRGQGRGYQTRINAILRREMLAALKKQR
ncbi:BrnA antitoxin family protein [Methylorubrum populi]|uniref:BrnA antitoxin family protein n=1 Tax=Methylorubrum populi TaxID=223967 RepID=UPI001FEDE848|nr:BrnA antitoxin family protein [Methylorubrum populi]